VNASGRVASLVSRVLAMADTSRASAFANWYGQKQLVYPNHLGPITWQRIVHTADGVFRADFQEILGREIILGAVHEPEVTQRIKETLRAGDVFVDVGANQGYFTMLASRIIGSDGLVLAFEPSLANLARFAENLSLSRCSNVLVFSVALSDTEGVSKISLPLTFNSGTASLGQGPSTNRDDPFGTGFTRTATRKLDTLFAALDIGRPIDLVKIDAEGHEPEVLRGMEAVLTSSERVQIAIEVSPASYSVVDLERYLNGLGFRGEFFATGAWRPWTATSFPDGLSNAWFSRR
jgi:FkbM family methyltransferase